MEEYIVKQEGDVYGGEIPIVPTAAQKVAQAYFTGALGIFQLGFLVLTNMNLYFVTAGTRDTLAATILAARTPFGLGRRVLSKKKLSLYDVYQYLNNPGSVRIPLRDIRYLEYHGFFRPVLMVGCLLKGSPRLYRFNFRSTGSKKGFVNELSRWVTSMGGRVDAKDEIFNPKCPTCGQPATWIPQYKRWYCYNCQKYI